ncbi:hypothetical protein QR680_003868 [Steinernema hermaphroditum]|uniref:ELM2 domain-containing protein n=1 Tax=Steinernema hermaphroditum TaxID=289476 RepID=A0AA39HP36_9BILA|nr:hypothetical protein QR680_003868 [Steinernema hermaphroditum]
MPKVYCPTRQSDAKAKIPVPWKSTGISSISCCPAKLQTNPFVEAASRSCVPLPPRNSIDRSLVQFLIMSRRCSRFSDVPRKTIIVEEPSPRQRRYGTRSAVQKMRPSVRVGTAFQADIPELRPKNFPLDESREETLWIPEEDDSKARQLSEQLGLDEKLNFNQDERLLLALYIANYNVERAAWLIESIEDANPPDRTITLPRKRIGDQELVVFSRGVKRFRKNFSEIRRRLLPRFTVGELVELYYVLKEVQLRKKSSRK